MKFLLSWSYDFGLINIFNNIYEVTFEQESTVNFALLLLCVSLTRRSITYSIEVTQSLRSINQINLTTGYLYCRSIKPIFLNLKVTFEQELQLILLCCYCVCPWLAVQLLTVLKWLNPPPLLIRAIYMQYIRWSVNFIIQPIELLSN